jgi:hypothetical protein
MEDLDMIAGGVILSYGSNAEETVFQKAEACALSGDQRKFERWRQILQRVRELRCRQAQ